LAPSFAGTRLRMELDKIPLWRGNHVSVRQLADDFARYIYLPRLAGPEVLSDAARDGVALLSWAQDGFAYGGVMDQVDTLRTLQAAVAAGRFVVAVSSF
jgi:hypothetical protein